MPLNELELLNKYIIALKIKTFEDLNVFIRTHSCTTNDELKKALIDEYIQAFERGEISDKPISNNWDLTFDEQETIKGKEYRLVEGHALRTNWSILKVFANYVVYYKTTSIRAVDTLEKAKRCCVEAYKLFY